MKPELGFGAITDEPSVICGTSASEDARELTTAVVEAVIEYAVSPIVMAGPPGKRV